MKKYEELIMSVILIEEEIVRTSNNFGEGNSGDNNLPWVDVTPTSIFID